jgi:molecular chaperone Hsp33
VSDAVGNVRGCVTEPKVELVEKYPGKLDVGATVGTDGGLTVIRDLQMKEPYIGSVPLISGEIGDDVTAYFAQSEQIPTACALGVLVDRDCSVKVAGGYLLQLLPGAPEETIDALEKGIQRAGAVTAMLEAGLTPEEILGQVCGDLGVVFMETTEVSYKCYCDRDRVTAALISLGRKELTEIADEGKTFPVECQFCDHIYEFTPEDIREILKKV